MHITLRIPQELLRAVDEAAAKRAMSRSKWIKDTLRAAILAPGAPPPGDPDLGAIQEQMEVEFTALQENVQTIQEVRLSTETILKLCIETVMIGRQLALQESPVVLDKAQAHAREYWTTHTKKTNGDKTSNQSTEPG